jgi:hypothetical protein
MKRYVFVIDGEVGPDLVFEETSSDQHQALAAALSSSPTVVEVPQGSEVQMGWTWDGTTFTEPAN